MTIAQPTLSAGQISDRILAVLKQDDTGDGPFSRASERPGRYKDKLTPFELDLRDWGVVYGMAFAIARGEDPFESIDSVAERALPAAEAAWLQVGQWHDREDER